MNEKEILEELMRHNNEVTALLIMLLRKQKDVAQRGECPVCHGSEYVGGRTCPECGGTGQQMYPDTAQEGESFNHYPIPTEQGIKQYQERKLTAQEGNVLDRVVKIVNHWTDNKLGDEALHIAMEVQQLLTAQKGELVCIECWDIINEGKSLDEISDDVKNEIAKRKIEELLETGAVNSSETINDLLDELDCRLDQQEDR